MTVSKIEINEFENITLYARMDNDQVLVATEKASRLMELEDVTGIEMFPVISNIGYETVVRDFSGRRLSRALEDQQHMRRKDIWKG